MTGADSGRVSHLLTQVREGREGAFDELFELVHAQLRDIAHRKWRKVPPGDTLQPTALVNEVYLRLTRKQNPDWKDRSHFLAIAARAMHDIIVERTRKHEADKRKPRGKRVPTYDICVSAETPAVDILDLETILHRLRSIDEKCHDVVVCIVFGRLTGDETAEALRVSPSTVDRKWKYAKAWLHRELSVVSR